LRGARGFFDALELFELLHAALDLGGFGSDLAETVDELLGRVDFLLLVAVGLELLLVALLALLEVLRIVAGVGDELLGVRVDLDDAFDQLVHEIAVVRDHQHRAGVVSQVALEPEQGKQVEVVRRLVEHQEVGLHDEQAGEVGAHDPAAGILAGRLVEVRLLVAEAGQNLLRLRFELVAVNKRELVLCRTVGRVAERAGGLVLAHRAQDVDHLRVDAHGDFQDRLVARIARFLREVAGDRVFIALDRAFIEVLLVEDHAEKRRFARAVGTDQGDAFAPVDGHFGLPEQGASAEGLGELMDAEHGGGVGRPGFSAKFQNVTPSLLVSKTANRANLANQKKGGMRKAGISGK